MGLTKYSRGHISDHHEPIHVKFGVWGFFLMFYWNMVMKMPTWHHTSVLYKVATFVVELEKAAGLMKWQNIYKPTNQKIA